MDLLDGLLDHDRWATTTLLGVCRQLTDDQFDQEFDVGHRTLRATFAHMIFNLDFWTRLMEGQPSKQPPDNPTRATLEQRFEQDFATFADFARRVRDEHRLDQTYLDHYKVIKSLGGTILMVILHNTEHRTEVLHILARLGVTRSARGRLRRVGLPGPEHVAGSQRQGRRYAIPRAAWWLYPLCRLDRMAATRRGQAIPGGGKERC